MMVNDKWPSQLVLVIKKPPANAGDIRDAGSSPGLSRSPGGGHGNPLQYSCLGNSNGQRSLGGLQLMGSQRAGRDRAAKHSRAQPEDYKYCLDEKQMLEF